MKRAIIASAALLIVSCSSQDKAGNAAAGGNEAAAPEAGGGAGAGGAAAAFQPGEWETTTQVTRMSMAGMPAGITPPMPPPTTVRHCMSPGEASRPNADFITGSNAGSGCSYSQITMAGGRIETRVQCSREGTTMDTTVSGQFTPTSFDVTQQAHISAGGITTDMESHTISRRIGDCQDK